MIDRLRLPANPTQSLWRIVLVAAAYAVTGWLGLQIPFTGSHITLVWLPTGIAVAALLRWGWGVWPGVYLGALAANLMIASPWLLAAGIGVGNTLGPLLAAWWLKRVEFRRGFERQKDVAFFVAAATGGMAVSALSGVANLYLAGLVASGALGTAWLTWWMGDAVGVLLAAPLLLTLSRESIESLTRNRVSVLLWLALAIPISFLAFFHYNRLTQGALPLAFLTLPMLVWAAMRFGNTGAATAALSLSVLAACGTAAGLGPFTAGDPQIGLFLLWSYMATTVVTGLLITALQTERIVAQNAVRESAARLRAMFDQAAVGIALLDTGGHFIDVNQQLSDMTGYSREEFAGMHFDRVVHPEDIGATLQQRERRERGDVASYALEKRYLTKAGQVLWVSTTTSSVFGPDGRVSHVLAVIKDITDQKRAELELRRSEEKFAKAFRSSPAFIAISTLAEGRYLEVNEAYERTTGFSRSEVIGRTAFEIGLWVDPDDRRRLMEILQRQGSVRNFETRFRKKSGAIMDCEASMETIDVDGVPCLLSVTEDVTERKAVAKALRASEARFRNLFELESDALFLVDIASGQLLEVNAAVEKLYGYSRGELLTMRASDLSAEPEVTRAAIKKDWVGLERRRHRKKDGTEFLVELGGSKFVVDGQQVHIAAIRDITPRLAAEQALHESEELYRTLIERSPEAITIHRDGKFIYFNPTADRIIGATPGNNLVGRPILDLIHPDSREIVLERLETFSAAGGIAPLLEMKFVRLDGTAIDVETQGTQIIHDGVPTTYVTWRNITARKQAAAAQAALETRVRESGKMEALGTMAGGIAHDFNNILAAIRGAVQLAKIDQPAHGKAASGLEQIEKSAARAVELVRQILAFSRGEENERSAQHLPVVVQGASQLLRASIPSAIEIRTRFQAGVPPVLASTVAIHRVLMNLAMNAAHAMGNAGRLDLEIDEVDVGNSPSEHVENLGPGSFVRLIVRDTGCGMDSETRARIFEPFYSTKGPQGGTGLGLSVVYGIVKEHGGAISVDSVPGKGTEFRIYFPAVAEAVAEPSAMQHLPAAPPRGSGERLLFVDDDEDLASISQALLQKMGYRVTACLSGDTALAEFTRDPDAFDALITDVNMPGMSGLELARRVREIRPQLPVIVMSGYIRDEDRKIAQALGIGEIHWKPNTVSDLAEDMRERLERSTT